MRIMARWLGIALSCLAGAAAAAMPVAGELGPRVMTLTRASKWVPVAAIRLPFRTFHPQGMVKIGENFYLSSVEVRVPPDRRVPPGDGHDRTTGQGVGHLFKFGSDGRLLADLIIGEGTAYHPGGIDYDGTSIWVPVSEYRPNSRTIIYRVDPATMTAKEAFRWPDHIGAIVHDVQDRALYGLNWGSRQSYRWPVKGGGTGERRDNPAQYIDYQDCHYAGRGQMLCAGVAGYEQGSKSRPFGLGGIELIDLGHRQPVWQVPIELRTSGGLPMTLNPYWIETTGTGLRAWFLPDDDISTLYVFDVATG